MKSVWKVLFKEDVHVISDSFGLVTLLVLRDSFETEEQNFQ